MEWLNGMEKYEITDELGRGQFAVVHLVKEKRSKKYYALKEILVDESKATRSKSAVLKEANLLSQLKHPHIVAFHDSFFDSQQKHLCIIQDYCDGGTLASRISTAKKNDVYFNEDEIMKWFVQITSALQFIHANKVLHRDIKPENVFVTKKNICKIGDFGISKKLDQTVDLSRTLIGTPCYLSPELCQDLPYSSKTDIWSLGCLLYEVCALETAFDANNFLSLIYKISQAQYKPLPSGYSDDMKTLNTKLLLKNPLQRPSACSILALSYVKDYLQRFVIDLEHQHQQHTTSKSQRAGGNGAATAGKRPNALNVARELKAPTAPPTHSSGSPWSASSSAKSPPPHSSVIQPVAAGGGYIRPPRLPPLNSSVSPVSQSSSSSSTHALRPTTHAIPLSHTAAAPSAAKPFLSTLTATEPHTPCTSHDESGSSDMYADDFEEDTDSGDEPDLDDDHLTTAAAAIDEANLSSPINQPRGSTSPEVVETLEGEDEQDEVEGDYDYESDFDSDEEVVTAAKDVQKHLEEVSSRGNDHVTSDHDTYFSDPRDDTDPAESNKCKDFITRHCIEKLGADKFNQVKELCRGGGGGAYSGGPTPSSANDRLKLQFKVLAGNEHVETCFLISEYLQ